jgi:hypothetical protein
MKPLPKYMLQDLEDFQELLFPGLKRLRSRAHENQVGLLKLERGQWHAKAEPSSKKVKVKESFQNYKIQKAFEERGTSLGVQLFKENYDNRSLNCKEVRLVPSCSQRIILLIGHQSVAIGVRLLLFKFVSSQRITCKCQAWWTLWLLHHHDMNGMRLQLWWEFVFLQRRYKMTIWKFI